MLRVEYQYYPDRTVLLCSGRILHGDGAETLLRTVMSQDARDVWLDLRGVESIDARGLGTLIAMENWARQENRNLEFVNVSKRVLDAIEITRLTPVLLGEMAAGRDDAA